MTLFQQQQQQLELHGDLLETIFSHVPLIDLVSASQVSQPWRDAVSSSLRHRNKPRPWLILHAQATRRPYATITHAYDPRSDLWIKISRPSIPYISALKSSHSNFLYMLSPSLFSFSLDPLNLNWHHADPPRVWRRDPIVARVGSSVVIAGGGCDFEDDPLAVEIYDLNARAWRTCDSMPASLRDSSASPWLSIAATDEKLIVTEKESGVTYIFDPETKSWSDPMKFGTSQPVSNHNIGFTNSGVILIGLCRVENVDRIKVWKIGGEELECEEEIGEMPLEYVEKLRSESFGFGSVDVQAAGNVVYVYNNTWGVEEIVACELVGGCRWWGFSNAVAREGIIADRFVFTCAEVGMGELQRVMRVANKQLEISSLS